MPLLWSLIPPSGPPSWLFGTMHIRDERVYQFCHSLYPLMLQADGYIGEMNLDHQPDSANLHFYQLKAFFNPRQYQKIRHQIQKSFGIDLHRYQHLHPLMIISAISHSILQADHSVSLDAHLWAFAREHHLALDGLESGEEQMTLLHAVDPKLLYKQLRSMSARPGQVRRFTDRALKLYLDQDIHALYRLTKSSLFHLREPILYLRNERMIQRITALPEDKSFFITAGAGHLSGKYGIIRGLRLRGWGVKPIRIQI